LANGSLSRTTTPVRRSGLPGGSSVSIPRLRAAPAGEKRLVLSGALVWDPLHIPRSGERHLRAREVTHPPSVPTHRGGEARDGYDDLERDVTMGSKLTRVTSEVQPEMFWGEDPYAPGSGHGYPGIPVTGRELRTRDLEVHLRQAGRYAGFRELTSNTEVETSIIGWVICSLLDIRDAHRRQEVELRQRIVEIEAAMDQTSTREWGTSRRLQTVIQELVDIEARCDPTGRSGGDSEARPRGRMKLEGLPGKGRGRRPTMAGQLLVRL
jgi:hypothetical protein